MTSTTIRTDIPYLRRRVKRGSVPEPSTKSVSLNLSRGDDAPATGPQPVLPASNRIPPLPVVDGKVVLTLNEPVVALDRKQSAIGSMVISGAEAFAWEANDGFGNLVLKEHDESTAPMFGNRRLAEFHKGEVVVGLRHFRNLRRLIVGTRMGLLKVKLYDGSEIVADGDNGNNALLISRVNNHLEVRLEKINSVDLVGIFGVQILP